MNGTVAVTDYGWYQHLLAHPELEEVNFWKPSASRPFAAPRLSPFFFKLKAPFNAICGFGYFADYSSLPDWLAWDTFQDGNGVGTLGELRTRIQGIRERIRFDGPASAEIGCILIASPVLFPQEEWVNQPADWHARTVQHKAYDLSAGEGARILEECLQRAPRLRPLPVRPAIGAELPGPRYGAPQVVAPRLGQGIFRIQVTDAYGRACAVTEEHSLPALEAAHIRPYGQDGPHEVRNGLLLRADLHRLFDLGYLGVSEDLQLLVSPRLRREFSNGRSYYPLAGKPLTLPSDVALQPDPSYLAWHRESIYAA